MSGQSGFCPALPLSPESDRQGPDIVVPVIRRRDRECGIVLSVEKFVFLLPYMFRAARHPDRDCRRGDIKQQRNDDGRLSVSAEILRPDIEIIFSGTALLSHDFRQLPAGDHGIFQGSIVIVRQQHFQAVRCCQFFQDFPFPFPRRSAAVRDHGPADCFEAGIACARCVPGFFGDPEFHAEAAAVIPDLLIGIRLLLCLAGGKAAHTVSSRILQVDPYLRILFLNDQGVHVCDSPVSQHVTGFDEQSPLPVRQGKPEAGVMRGSLLPPDFGPADSGVRPHSFLCVTLISDIVVQLVPIDPGAVEVIDRNRILQSLPAVSDGQGGLLIGDPGNCRPSCINHNVPAGFLVFADRDAISGKVLSRNVKMTVYGVGAGAAPVCQFLFRLCLFNGF